MTRRFEVGPILVALGAIVLLVSLFLDWYGGLTAWEAFEVVEVMLAALAVTALVIAAGLLAPGIEYVERRWMPAVVLGILLLVAAEIVDPPPAAGDQAPTTGAWLAIGSALVMFAGAVLTFGRVSFAVSVEDRDVRERVAVVDHRQDTTESAAVDGGRVQSAERTTD
jgi:SNF family Na+-dependent transporter